MFYVYFIKSLKTDKVYVGSTSRDPFVRLEEHNLGKNSWTKKNRPFELVYFEEFICKEDSLKKELFYKKGFGQQIKKVIVEYVQQKGIRPRREGFSPKG